MPASQLLAHEILAQLVEIEREAQALGGTIEVEGHGLHPVSLRASILSRFGLVRAHQSL
jgi:hypothetical protein